MTYEQPQGLLGLEPKIFTGQGRGHRPRQDHPHQVTARLEFRPLAVSQPVEESDPRCPVLIASEDHQRFASGVAGLRQTAGATDRVTCGRVSP